jgi:hypothetical protein
MTKVLLNEFGGKGDMLGEKISFLERVDQRWDHLHGLLLHSSHLPPNAVIVLFGIALILFLSLLVSKKLQTPGDKTWLLSFSFIVFSAIFYLLFSQKLKIWYTLGLSVPIAIFFGGFLNYLFENRLKLLKPLPIILLILLVYYSIKSQTDYITAVAFKPSNDRSSMQNELAALDWIYQNAEGEGFKVYSYLPSVYDFPYNHLFWWYGNDKYGYQPFETAYLPNQPEYIADVDQLWVNKRDMGANNLIFLVIEEDFDMPVRTEAWMGNFSKLCQIKEVDFPWHAKVKMMTSCSK